MLCTYKAFRLNLEAQGSLSWGSISLFLEILGYFYQVRAALKYVDHHNREIRLFIEGPRYDKRLSVQYQYHPYLGIGRRNICNQSNVLEYKIFLPCLATTLIFFLLLN
jgi:hypothetical protein